MKIAAHITFFYDSTRLHYLTKSIESLAKLDAEVHIFLYTNKRFKLNIEGVKVKFLIFSYLKNFRWQFKFNHFFNKLRLKFLIHPFYLTWENRRYIKRYVDDFQIQMYLEDDIEFTQQNLEYYLSNKDQLYNSNYNVGFLRIEHDSNNNYWYTDLWETPSAVIQLDGKYFLENTVNPYHAFWIYDKKTIKEFISKKEWVFQFEKYNTREKSAIGLHGKGMDYFKGSLIPLNFIDGKYVVDLQAHVRHLPNNYIGHHAFCTQKYPISFNQFSE